MPNYRFVLTPQSLGLLESQAIFFSLRAHECFGRMNKFFFFDDKTYVHPHSSIGGGQRIFDIGSFSYCLSPMTKGISIGNYCSIAIGVRERPENHPYERFTTSSLTYGPALYSSSPQKQLVRVPNSFIRKPYTIQHDVWIGENTLIRPGITIHTGAIVAARSNVTKDVPPYHIVGGNPARLIKLRFPEKTIEDLLNSQWFNYDITVLPIKGDISIPDFLNTFYESKEKNIIECIRKPKTFIEKLQELSIPFEEI